MIVEQFLPALHWGDAIGNSTLHFHRFLKSQGVDSRIVALSIDAALQEIALDFNQYSECADSIKVLHFAVPSVLTDFFISARGRKVMIYHNVTPPEFFVNFSPELTRFTRTGRDHLQKLSRTFDLCVADSRYNANELLEIGYECDIRVFPIMIDPAEYDHAESSVYRRLLSDERDTIIFVGRVSPNKKIEDLIKVLFFYKKYISPSIRLVVSGKTDTLPGYFYALRDLAGRFYLDAEDILFTGHIPFSELLAVYRSGDVFLSMSEHEGFCLPLIESCLFKVPVLAYDAGAVAETLDGAGILFRQKSVEMVAGMAQRLIGDPELRARLKKAADERMAAYRRQSNPQRLLEWLAEK